MSQKIILFADNTPEFLETRAEFLEKEGYQVLLAHSPSKAEDLLRNARLHLAILDLRLTNDDDERDISGLEIALNETYRNIPKIILTGYGGVEAARRALRQSSRGFIPAINYLEKREGPEALIQAVNDAFVHHVRINWNLVFDPQGIHPNSLVDSIESGLQGEQWKNRADELEDLFRRLFYEKDRIRIERVLWRHTGRVALTVFAFKEGAAMEQFVAVCGQNALVVEEAERVQKLAPKAQGETSTTLAHQAETTHFAANAYALGQADLETVHTLYEIYRGGDRNVFKAAMQNLFDKVLPAWHQNPPVPAKHALEDFYRERLGLTAERVSPQVIRARWDALVHHLPEFKTLVPDPEPIATLLQATVYEHPARKIKSPGMLTGASILVDVNSNRVWLTDFADAGDVPELWDFVTLESVIRFDWVEEKQLERLKEIETNLLDDEHFGEPSTAGVESAAARQAVSFIQRIRRHAARVVGKEHLPYHLGIFFHAARRAADFDLGLIDKPLERARLAHALLAMAKIAAKVGKVEREVAAKGERGLRVDNDGVKRDGKRISIRGQSRDLLDYLANPPNQLRKRQDIIENVLKEKFNPKDEHQISRLHTAVRRLREKIEYDPDNPCFLLTESDGYRLVLQPDK